MNEKKTVELNIELLNGIMQYLGTKPYQETFQLIQAIQEQVIPQIPVPDAAKGAAAPVAQ